MELWRKKAHPLSLRSQSQDMHAVRSVGCGGHTWIAHYVVTGDAGIHEVDQVCRRMCYRLNLIHPS